MYTVDLNGHKYSTVLFVLPVYFTHLFVMNCRHMLDIFVFINLFIRSVVAVLRKFGFLYILSFVRGYI